ncbi:signal transduction histidine kinase with CheB and CheR activity [Flammeovirgaceae bacterium 311]|nr:signal transduction histidine kinase with CheB and CheR activity [Flammeovirgaceae bacterium 311]
MNNNKAPLRIIAIGASAGGIDALYTFFDHTPLDNVAYVVIQHLSPSHQSRLAQVLQKHSPLQIYVAEDNTPVEKNRVYVIPSHAYLTIQGGRLQLTGKERQERPHLTIDTFFISLAADQGAKAIGVILSGTGKDGSEGIGAIRKAGGWVLVQDPLTSQFDQMPLSAIATGWVSSVQAPQAMPAAIQAQVGQPLFLHPTRDRGAHPPPRKQTVTRDPALGVGIAANALPEEPDTYSQPKMPFTNDQQFAPDSQEGALLAILEFIKRELPQDFSDYKRPTIFRRIQRRMGMHSFSQALDYLEFLQANPLELKALAQDFLISVTSFFRDQPAFKVMEEQVIPDMVAQGNQPLKIWVPGCATGEEAYSLAILVAECLEKAGQTREVKIFATDLDDTALSIASRGEYPGSIANSLTPERIARFFNREGEGFKVTSSIRQMLIFAHHDLTQNPPYCNTDLISCRNLLIYLNPVLQKKVFSLLHFGLHPGGYLFLGSSEQAPIGEHHFTEISKQSRIYQKTAAAPNIGFEMFTLPQSLDRHPLPTSGVPPSGVPPSGMPPNRKSASLPRKHTEFQFSHTPSGMPPNGLPPLESVINALLENTNQVGVCLDGNRRVVQAFGDLAPFLQLKAFNFNLVELMPQPLLVAFGTAFQQVVQSNEPIAIGGIPNELATAGSLRLLLKPLVSGKTSQKLFLLLFSHDTLPPKEGYPAQSFEPERHTREYIASLEQQLLGSEQNLQDAYEKLDAYAENMQSFNEELLSAGEEMQSSNEELHSVNEELHTINAEYQQKIRELTELNDDLENYFRSNVSGQLFVDGDLLLKKFSPAAVQHINLRKSDLGRPLDNITTNIEFETIVEDIRLILAGEETITREVQAKTGKWFQVSVMGYIRAADNHPTGAMVTFYDITNLVKARRIAEESQRQALKMAQELDITNEQLKRTNVDLDNFVYTASHDLRSPVNNIIGLMGLLSSSLPEQLDEYSRKLLEMAEEAVVKLMGVINDLTEIAKVQKEEGETEPISVRVMLEEVLAELEEPIQEAQALIHTEITVEEIVYPRKHLRSILYNLISNAIKYRSNDRVPEIHVSLHMLEGHPVLVVADNGLGLLPKQVPKLFSLYKRFHNHVEGTGIGLHIIKRMVENNGGRIEVESQYGKGTTFTVYFSQPKNK